MSSTAEERPATDPAKLLSIWMEFERGQASPGQVLADMKRAGMRELLDATVAAHEEAFGTTTER